MGSSSQQGPRDWLCQTAGAAAPPGGRELHEVSDRGGSCHFQMLYGVCIQAPTTTSQTRVTGMKIFQPRRMIWS